jgi:hypothetical protein
MDTSTISNAKAEMLRCIKSLNETKYKEFCKSLIKNGDTKKSKTDI